MPTRSRRVSSDELAPLGVVVLWRPHAVSRQELWGSVATGLRDLVVVTHDPVAAQMGDPEREVAIVEVPWCRDEPRLRDELHALWESAGLLSAYDIAPTPEDAGEATDRLRRLFDTFPLARMALARPSLSVDEILPYRPFVDLAPDEIFRLVHRRLGAVLVSAAAEEWMLPTLRALFDAVRWTFEGLAVHLGISVNGLRKRLDKLSALTGHDLARARAYFTVPFDLRLSVQVYDLFAHQLPAPGDEVWRPAPNRET